MMINFNLLNGGFLINNTLRNSRRLGSISTLKNDDTEDEVEEVIVVPKEVIKVKNDEVKEVPKEEVIDLKERK